ncbi:MAG TPA: hypothetical protein VJ736_04365 [Actinomycetota bacterium]|jgi:hypothetical protein|nr:hypothetical protein [Actinomycetota bacterium]
MNRYLVVSDLMVGSTQLKDFVRNQLGEDRSTFHLVVPAMPDRRRLAWDESEAHLIARRRLVNGLEWMREVDPRADGEVGDVDPILAIEDALRTTAYDAIVLAVRERPHRRRLRVAARARQAFDLPVVDVLTAA